MGRILEADLLTWAGQHDAAAAVLVAARTALRDATAVPEAMRSALVVQLIRRQVELAAAAQDSPAVSAFAGEGIAAVEADRQRLSLPYLQDSYLRDRRLIYVAGMAAARRLDDLDLLLERADLVKARGAVAWLRAGPAPVKAVRASLAADEAVIYHLWADRTVLYVITVAPRRDRVRAPAAQRRAARRPRLAGVGLRRAAPRRELARRRDPAPGRAAAARRRGPAAGGQAAAVRLAQRSAAPAAGARADLAGPSPRRELRDQLRPELRRPHPSRRAERRRRCAGRSASAASPTRRRCARPSRRRRPWPACTPGRTCCWAPRQRGPRSRPGPATAGWPGPR